MAWAHLSEWVCEQKMQLSKHTVAFWKFKSSPATFLDKQQESWPTQCEWKLPFVS